MVPPPTHPTPTPAGPDAEATPRAGDLRLVRRLLALAWEHRLAALPALATTIILQLLTLAELAGQGLAIDLIRRQADPDAPAPHWPFGLEPPENWSFLQTVIALGVAVLLLSLLSGVARYGTRVCDEIFVQSCIVDLRVRLYDKLQRLGFRYFDTHDTGQIINYVTADAQSVRSFIQGVMIRVVIAAATLAVFLTYMLREHVGLTLACLAILPVQVFVMARYGRRTRPRFLQQAALVDRLVKRLAESIAGVRVIRAFGREKAQAAWFDEAAEEAMAHRIAIGRDQGAHIPIIQSGNILALAVLLGFGGWLVILGPEEGGLALGALWIFRGLLGRLGAQAEAIVQVIASAPEALAGAQRVFNLIDEPVTIDSPPGGGIRLDALRGGIRFEHVSFRHAPDLPLVLHDISFEAQAGETVAIVGPTGSGKSTLLQLIARFHDPTEGRVLLDGRDLRQYDVRTLRAGIGMVFQDPFLFSNTIGANVAFGRPDAGEEAVREVAAAAAADGFIMEQERGYQTIIGERGVSLSGGERQRLTIARALLVDPPVLLLDDPTGSVDAVTESRIQEALDEFRSRGSRGGPRTTFIVAHRLSTLRRADRVIVLDHGRIVATGTHDDLMDMEGHYREAALIQLGM